MNVVETYRLGKYNPKRDATNCLLQQYMGVNTETILLRKLHD